jgi:hypothetical protein
MAGVAPPAGRRGRTRGAARAPETATTASATSPPETAAMGTSDPGTSPPERAAMGTSDRTEVRDWIGEAVRAAQAAGMSMGQLTFNQLIQLTRLSREFSIEARREERQHWVDERRAQEEEKAQERQARLERRLEFGRSTLAAVLVLGVVGGSGGV